MYHTTAHEDTITIRLAGAEHASDIRRLAELDSAAVPRGQVLVALVGERMLAAVALSDGRAIADPFRPTSGLVTLLSERAIQLRSRGGSGLRSRLAGRLRGGRGSSRARLAPQPAGTLRSFD